MCYFPAKPTSADLGGVNRYSLRPTIVAAITAAQKAWEDKG
jgi:hypothetical protein